VFSADAAAVGWGCRLPRRTPTAESQVAVSKPGIVQEKTSIQAFGALQLTFALSPPFRVTPERELDEINSFGKVRHPLRALSQAAAISCCPF